MQIVEKDSASATPYMPYALNKNLSIDDGTMLVCDLQALPDQTFQADHGLLKVAIPVISV